MATTPGFNPTRFRAAAGHYLAGRPPYASRLIRRVVALCGLRSGHRVLDLGCGPGLLAVAFAPFVAEVVAVDPEPEMRRVAHEVTSEIGNIRVFAGSSDDLSAASGQFHLVTMGRSFHWMDREATLRRLDQMLEPKGAIGLFGDRHPELPDNAWRAAWREALYRHAGDSPASHTRQPGWIRHEAILLGSVFSLVDYVAAIERRQITVATLVDRALSMSTMAGITPNGRIALSADIASAVAPWVESGRVTEVVESYAYLAWRREEAPA